MLFKCQLHSVVWTVRCVHVNNMKLMIVKLLNIFMFLTFWFITVPSVLNLPLRIQILNPTPTDLSNNDYVVEFRFLQKYSIVILCINYNTHTTKHTLLHTCIHEYKFSEQSFWAQGPYGLLNSQSTETVIVHDLDTLTFCKMFCHKWSNFLQPRNPGIYLLINAQV